MGKKKIVIIVSSIVVIIGLLVVLKLSGVIKTGENAKEVTFEKISRKNITETVSASGTIKPQVEVKIAPEVSGEIIMLNIKEGDEVKQGQLLVQIKPDIYESALKRAEAAVEQSKSSLLQSEAKLKEQEQEYARSKKLIETQSISQSEWDAAQANYTVAKTQYQASKAILTSSEASLVEARDNLKRTRIYAPIDGTVSKLNVEQGERVVGTAQMAGTEVLRVANLDAMEVRVSVNETDIVKLAVGNPVEIEVDSYWGKKFAGIVFEIGSSSSNQTTTTTTNSSEVANFDVKILILEDSYKNIKEENKLPHTPFKPGMNASVVIKTKEKKDVLACPIKAVAVREIKDSFNQKNLSEVVFIRQNDIALQQKVEIGIQDDEFIEIISGIDPNDEIITGPYSIVSKELKDSTKVKTKK